MHAHTKLYNGMKKCSSLQCGYSSKISYFKGQFSFLFTILFAEMHLSSKCVVIIPYCKLLFLLKKGPYLSASSDLCFWGNNFFRGKRYLLYTGKEMEKGILRRLTPAWMLPKAIELETKKWERCLSTPGRYGFEDHSNPQNCFKLHDQSFDRSSCPFLWNIHYVLGEWQC